LIKGRLFSHSCEILEDGLSKRDLMWLELKKQEEKKHARFHMIIAPKDQKEG
jgi:hypothetical protein